MNAEDAGLWLFAYPPVERLQARYGVTLTPAWLARAQQSSVRFANGGSGAFVSTRGLTITNQHVVQSSVRALSTATRDLVAAGYYAARLEDELKCPNLELHAVSSIEDVTGAVNEGTATLTAADAGARQRANIARIEQECRANTGLLGQVVSLYAGALFELYRYREYTDVRLVFVPEADIALFGGDTDNYEFPRHDLDVAFLRVYEHDEPAAVEQCFRWSSVGVVEDDPVLISGFPGVTDRLATLAQLAVLRDTSLPYQIDANARRAAALRMWSLRSDEHRRRAEGLIVGLDNSVKRDAGCLASLRDPQLIARKQAEEQTLRQSAACRAAHGERQDDPWAIVEIAMAVERRIFLPLALVEYRGGFAGSLAGHARTLVRAAAERQKPNAERLPEWRESALPSVERALFTATPADKDLNEIDLAASLALLQRLLPTDPATRAALNGRSPADAAHALVHGTCLDDPAERRRIYDGCAASIAASADPLIVLMRTIDAEARSYRTTYEDDVASPERLAGARIEQLRFATSGFGIPPDATFTLRLSSGAVRGYVEDGQGHVAAKGTHVFPFTTIAGAFDRAAQHGNAPPFRLPPTWHEARRAGRLDLDTPLAFACTNDMSGGISGAPVLDAAGDVVGIVFDSNRQSLSWRYAYDDRAGRAISVDSRGILAALQQIYHADRIVEELRARG